MVSSYAFHKYIFFIHFTKCQANGQWPSRFCSLPRIFFSCIALVFWTALFESTYGRLLLEQCFSFRGLVIIPEGPRQATSQLNDNSLLTHSNYYTFIWLLWCKFLYMVRKKLTKQTNTTVNRLAKWSFKTQLKNTLKIIF